MRTTGTENAHLIVSDGVTAKIASIIPAPSPAKVHIPRSQQVLTCKSSTGATYRQDCAVQRPSPGRDAVIFRLAGTSRAATYIGICESMLEMVIRDEPHSRLGCISNDKRGTPRIESANTLRTQRIANDGKRGLSLRTAELYRRRKQCWESAHTLPPNCERVLVNSAGYVTNLMTWVRSAGNLGCDDRQRTAGRDSRFDSAGCRTSEQRV